MGIVLIGKETGIMLYLCTRKFDWPFIVLIEADEKSLLQRFIDHVLEVKPYIIVTYNWDSFDR